MLGVYRPNLFDVSAISPTSPYMYIHTYSCSFAATHLSIPWLELDNPRIPDYPTNVIPCSFPDFFFRFFLINTEQFTSPVIVVSVMLSIAIFCFDFCDSFVITRIYIYIYRWEKNLQLSIYPGNPVALSIHCIYSKLNRIAAKSCAESPTPNSTNRLLRSPEAPAYVCPENSGF
jgi:hypothetical protein